MRDFLLYAAATFVLLDHIIVVFNNALHNELGLIHLPFPLGTDRVGVMAEK